MQQKEKVYIAIDLKSFYASVECQERGLDPLTTNLVVADKERSEKTICLAVTPSLKSYGINGRPRLFEVVQKVREINQNRRWKAPRHQLVGSSYDDVQLKQHKELALDYIVAPPRMAHYISCSSQIYSIYLRYIAPEDMHVYSIDEVFMDVTSYLKTYDMNARQLAEKIIQDVLNETGITATAGIGSNLFLCKVAMDIVAKHCKPNKNGVRIAQLDEATYRKYLWSHRPLTDFWRVGKGYIKKLEEHGLYTMGDIARCSIGKENEYYNEDLLYKLFGVNAELLIDHAWGYESCTIADIKQYKPDSKSLGLGQVLHSAYSFEKAKIVVKEMVEGLTLDLVDKGLVTKQIVLTIGYDFENLNHFNTTYHGEITTDVYGRKIPKHAHGTTNLKEYTSSTKRIVDAVVVLFDHIVNRQLSIRRINISANHVISSNQIKKRQEVEQLDLFTDYDALQKKKEEENEFLIKEKKAQQAMLMIKRKYGKNAILKGRDLEEGATTKERNNLIGGHRA